VAHPFPIYLSLPDRREADVRTIGVSLGQNAQPGDCIALIGDLGAGKTTLTKGIAAGLGIDPDEVTSPTFSLLAERLGGRIPLYHIDAYRLDNWAAMTDIGFDDYVRQADGLIVVEWADIVADALPSDHLTVTFGFIDGEPALRSVTMCASGPLSARLGGLS